MLRGELILDAPAPLHRLLAVLFALLVCLGLIALFDATFFVIPGNPYFYSRRTFYFLLAGIVAFHAGREVSPATLRRLAWPLLLAAMAAMLLVWLPGLGRTVNNARRWIFIGPLGFQPAEFAKLAYLLYLCDFLSRKEAHLARARETFWPLVLVLGAGLGLVLITRDLGTVVLFGAVALVVCFLAGMPLAWLFSLLGAGALGATGFVLMEPYRVARVRTFFAALRNPGELSSDGAFYHLYQALTAVAEGGLRGAGPGNTLHRLPHYIPEAHTDSIFVLFAGAFGFLGTLLLVAALLAIVCLGLKAARRSRDRFDMLFVAGLTCLLVFQSLIHIGGNLGIIPMKGITLPFFSYGGSSLVFSLLAAGLMVNVARRCPPGAPRVRLPGRARPGYRRGFLFRRRRVRPGLTAAK